MSDSKKGINRWLLLFILALACGAIYQLPYLRYSYYDQMIVAFNVTNTQLGLFMTVYGLASLPCYLVGGLFAMKFSDKLLLPGGMLITGIAGLWFSTFPGFVGGMICTGIWAFSTSLVFWPAIINFVRGMGDSSEQGRLYGLFEGLRGITATAIGLIIVAIFASFASDIMGLKAVIISWSVWAIFLGLILIPFIPDNKGDKEQSRGEFSIGDGIRKAFTMPITWACSGIVFFTMMIFDCMGYTTPYMTACLGATATFAAAFGTVRTWGLQFAGGTLGGIIGDRIGNAKTLIFGFAVIIIGFLVLNFLPQNSSMVWPAAIFILIFGCAIYINRGVYFAVTDEAQVPVSINAAVVGIVSAIGFTPDAFIYTIIGYFLDNYPGALGYKITFWMAVGCGVCGFLCAFWALHIIKAKRNKQNEEVEAA